MISAPESMHTRVSFGFSITEPISTAVQPAHGDCDSTSAALNSMLDGCIQRTEFLQLEVSQLSLKSLDVSFPLLGHEVTFWSCR